VNQWLSRFIEVGETKMSSSLSWLQILQVTGISIILVLYVVGPIFFVYRNFSLLFSPTGAEEQALFAGMLLMGVAGSAGRGVERLFSDVGGGKYDSSWNLSLFLRPLEGAIISLITYLALKAGMILLEKGSPQPNAYGFLFFGVLAGMFSHRAPGILRDKFFSLWAARRDA
jgi:hypothetical protein